MLNLAICLVCLVKLFVYGEPIISESEMQKYSIEKKKADQLMSEVKNFLLRRTTKRTFSFLLEFAERGAKLLSAMLREARRDD